MHQGALGAAAYLHAYFKVEVGADGGYVERGVVGAACKGDAAALDLQVLPVGAKRAAFGLNGACEQRHGGDGAGVLQCQFAIQVGIKPVAAQTEVAP